ncbi:MAG: Lrp/AsnC ligand binding domain-containing protein [Thermoplasmata archaeon]|nr:Lrp/AsnC ligand binding domain-containing protein [Thermoplasmata archaeon]
MTGEEKQQELEGVLSSYYEDEDRVLAMIMMKVDTKAADEIAEAVANFQEVKDVFLVTGDIDIIMKVWFSSYGEMKKFVMENLATIEGVKETRTMLVVTPYKESGEILVVPTREEESKEE